MKRKIRQNTDAEEAEIQRGIAADPDNPEWTAEDFARARPAKEMLPPALYAELTAPKRGRGPGVKPTKAQVTLRLDRDVIEGLRATGPGWQARANAALRRMVKP
jgi:uncharacterized protein (DUF4415 family)